MLEQPLERDTPASGLTLQLFPAVAADLESEACRNCETLDDLLSRAAAHFNANRSTRRAAMLVPAFKPGWRGTPCQVRLDVSRECWEGLESDAGRRGVPLKRLLEHAALLYLADLDSHRLANRVVGHAGGPR